MPRALIVHAHPEPDSFCTAQMHAARGALQAQGYEVEVSDLYALGWHAALDRHDVTHAVQAPFKPQAEQQRAAQAGTFAPELQAELDKLRRAEVLVFSFPLWWFSLPALLKGWVDRVFAMGEVYGAGRGTYDQGVFRGRRALLLLTTGGPEAAYGPGGRNGELLTLLQHVHHGMLWFCGYTVLAPVVGYAPARQSPEARAAQLQAVVQAFGALESRPVLYG
ncbi:NAD(P)H-dependent oxidoreductase [Deinococcus multiflagellatus]|uniref:NAD(P)H-dependent oxidoreductase n=1 Tax=Deinococcus multiflagellatus TaxID=1656887 RepID=A0ABW1ZQE8_9DEIO|nr:NAD(P)H-dependent oxidoreductase [Deinococcus multiflagellatus]MBZ9714141.1 NAD(P)H-dependent oxidoreductase [Deinococcus multiflagellatus]